ncbi:MAG: helix-turn-helix domain-containing protein [Patescibacteria group bacterium]|nr:helix-turn-helix domain-containing protein [Patescibacteria group bacterium]
MPKMSYSVLELAKILGISRIAVFKKIKNGTIKAEKVGRNYVIKHEDVEHLIPEILSDKLKEEIETSVGRVVKEYGETLKKLSRE